MKPEWEIINITCNKIRNILKEKYIGHVTAWVKDDMLEVNIDNGMYTFVYFRPNYIDYILEKGVDSILYELNMEYKTDLYSRIYKGGI